MSNSYLECLLLLKMKHFSKTERVIAEHFITIEIEGTNKTLSDLSEDIGFSEATIFKFVKK